MIEKFYIAEEGSRLREDYLRYSENTLEVCDMVNIFCEQNDIEAFIYHANSSGLSIEATDKDLKRFGNQLCNPDKFGLSRFKKNSKMHKKWVKLLEENNVEVLNKPYVPFYFHTSYTKAEYSIFSHIDGEVYVSIRANGDFEPNDELREIKGSEYHKVLEYYK